VTKDAASERSRAIACATSRALGSARSREASRPGPHWLDVTEQVRSANDVIRTPDQRLRVFVSSTLEELTDERRAVSRAISALRLADRRACAGGPA
jgi:hypothetical protein